MRRRPPFLTLFLAAACAPVLAQAPALTLEDAVERAIAASQVVRRDELGVAVARAELDQARAAFLPSLTGSVGAGYNLNPPDGITIPAGAFGTVADPTSTFPTPVPEQPVVLVPDPEHLGFNASVLLEQPVFTWGKLRAGEQAAVARVDASAARRGLSERAVRRDVTVAFAGLLAGRASERLLQEIVDVQEARVADSQSRFDAGASTRRELLGEEAGLAAARSQLVRVSQGVLTATAGLRRLLGEPSGSVVGELGEPSFPVELPDEATLVRMARESHPRLAELRSVRDQAVVQLSVAEASRPFLPDIGLRLKAEVQGQRVPLVQANWSDTWDANLTISLGASASLYDGGANRASRASAQAQYEQSLSAVAEYHDAIPLEVRAALERYLVSAAAEREASARREQAQEQLRVALVSLENELITSGEALAARLPVLEARLAIIAARLGAARGFAALEYAAGPLR